MPTYAITVRKTTVIDEIKIIECDNLEFAIEQAKIGEGPCERQICQPGSTVAINAEMRRP